MKRLVLLPDTNLFFQCKVLEDIDWRQLTDADAITLVIAKPVLREIEKHKAGGNSRRADRARKMNTRLRPLQTTDQESLIVRKADPTVEITLCTALLPAAELSDRLNYGEPDDTLIGVAQAYRAANPDLDARVLSHDGGLLGTAKAVGVPRELIPDQWLLPQEADEATKRFNQANEEIRRLKANAPAIEHTVSGADGADVDIIRIEQAHFEQLTDAETRSLLARLKQRFPLVTDFSKRPPAPRLAMGFPHQQQFDAPSEAAIDKYTKEHEKWLSSCHYKLKFAHISLEHARGIPTFVFIVKNTGVVPARDALVTLTAKGEFEIKPPPYQKEDGEPVDAASPLLPPAPIPPKGAWRLVSPVRSMMDVVGRMHSPFGGLDPYQHVRIPTGSGKEDPNDFYYKGGRANDPVASFQLRCAQWRHGQDEGFEFEIYPEMREGQIEGAVILRVEAENLPEPYEKAVPVRITRAATSTLEEAQRLVESL